ncbi:MAG: outer membrane beta-barrel protein [Bacteroidales bacterium]
MNVPFGSVALRSGLVRLSAGGLLLAAIAVPARAQEVSRSTREQQLEARVAELEQQLRKLTARLDAMQPGAPAPNSDAVTASQPGHGLTSQPDPVPAASATQPPSPWKGVTYGAALEGYYQYNWNRPADGFNALRAYDTRANTFSIAQADFIVDAGPDLATGRRFGVRGDLQLGQATDTVQGNAANEPRPDLYRYLWQAFGSYVFHIGKGLQVDFGKFASSLGYETNYAKDNPNFSRALLFDFLPFYHSGFRASLPVNDRLTVQYMLTNGVQQTEGFDGFKSQQVSAIVKPIPTLSWTINYFAGRQGSSQGPSPMLQIFDTYAAFTPTPRVLLVVDINRTTSQVATGESTASLNGLGLYGRYQFTTPFAVAVRFERLADQALFMAIIQRVKEATITSEYKLADGFLARAEFRRDWSDQLFFPASGGALRDHQNTLLLGLLWWVGSKQGSW